MLWLRNWGLYLAPGLLSTWHFSCISPATHAGHGLGGLARQRTGVSTVVYGTLRVVHCEHCVIYSRGLWLVAKRIRAICSNRLPVHWRVFQVAGRVHHAN
jgi:hypothetical protein